MTNLLSRVKYRSKQKNRRVILILILGLALWSVHNPQTQATTLCRQGHKVSEKEQADADRNYSSDAAPRQSKDVKIDGGIISIPDSILLDQDGKRVRFYSDLIKGKVVVIGFFYSSCMSLCLRHGRAYARLQDELGDLLGKDVFLISVTFDPETDTPERLKEWSRKYDRREGWTLVTGTKEEVGKVVGQLPGSELGRVEMHTAFLFLGNDRTESWITAYGLENSKELAKKIRKLIE